MKFQRTIPPAAAPMNGKDLLHGLAGTFLGGRYLKRIEREMKEYFGVRHIFFVSSGKAAMTLILAALKGLSAKKQVVIPAYTCFSVPSAIVKAGLEIALCDIDSATLDFDYGLLGKTIGPDTLCVIPTHLFGIPSDVERINKLCRDREIFVVEDAAQAMGGTQNGKMLGTIGDVGFFSLGRGKNITCGSGGVIVTNSDRIAGAMAGLYSKLPETTALETLKEFVLVTLMALFIRPALYWFPEGLPFLKLGQTEFHPDFPMKKLSGMKAGLLRNWREHLEQSGHDRAETAAYFHERIGLKRVRESAVSYLRFPVIMENRGIRDRIYSLSRNRGLGISLMYPTAINEIREIRANFTGKAFPSASGIAEELLTLPTHQFLSEDDKEGICKLFDEAFAFKPPGRVFDQGYEV
jgi:dTDP-4-amino-4,6-dideoxygalactose transaminase